MNDNSSVSEILHKATAEEEMRPPTPAPSSSGTEAVNSAMIDKSIQIDMDCDPDEDPKQNKRYWQNLAGLRGAREQYLQDDVRDFGARHYRQADYINYLKSKLNMAVKELTALKAKQCRCQKENERPAYRQKIIFGRSGL